MSVKPLEDRILIKPIEAETKTKSGIFLPESAKEKPMQGTVVALGPGKLLDNGERGAVLIHHAGASWRFARFENRTL